MSNGTTLGKFQNIPDRMLWKGAALRQIEEFKALAAGLGFPWQIVGSHTSKSIQLPVLRISIGGAEVYVRDNFYDSNVCVIAEQPIEISLSVLFEDILVPKDWAWYQKEIRRARNYSWREWTDEQMDDPLILTLDSDAPSYMLKSAPEKVAWLKRMTDPTWYSKNWSSGTVTWDGDFGPDTVLWIQCRGGLEGISSLVPNEFQKPYIPGCTGFATALFNMELVEPFITRLSAAIKGECDA